MTQLEDLEKNILAGQRRALAKGITLVESSRADHQAQAQNLLASLLPATGKSIRLGFTGTPGVGKSTFIEAFGLFLIKQGYRVAVLAVDPSSTRTGGSILGDKTRMELLSKDTGAFIRPTPSGGTLGGVARRTREAMLLCEAAGYDVILVETVGVGQSEIAVADMVDMFLLMLSPGGGDELQGIKRGIMELADLVIINKADGDLEKPAIRAAADYKSALHLMRPKTACWTAHVVLASALKGQGMEEVWQQIQSFQQAMTDGGELDKMRREQAKSWMWAEIQGRLKDHFRDSHRDKLRAMEIAVRDGRITPAAAARDLLKDVTGE
ncbi:YgfD: protein that forms a complex with the methylmalonyl-CoA mutase in a pathway for conversion of succinyl-CoA to propionyl-CoA [hydrothermal vent metagenome]|uniref:YgfD: protein that forms a complex with the methylmalonyl-CoA mutase in a pathway for conversion of succinyl-CoA to propionyl-CoA n=1 Tax=hydrothermal vent metagenome TaxID=652676 RepID=A0A3B0S0N1_9ZZZZ